MINVESHENSLWIFCSLWRWNTPYNVVDLRVLGHLYIFIIISLVS